MHQDLTREQVRAFVLIRRAYRASSFRLVLHRVPAIYGPLRAVVYDATGESCGGIESHDPAVVAAALAVFLDLSAKDCRFYFRLT